MPASRSSCNVRARAFGNPGSVATGAKYASSPAPIASKIARAAIASAPASVPRARRAPSILVAAAFGWGIVRVAKPSAGTLVERVGAFVAVRRSSAKSEVEAPRRRVDLLHGAEGAFERLRWWPRFKATLELADINASPTQIVLLTLLGTAIVMMVLFVLIGGLGILLGLAVLVALKDGPAQALRELS